MANSSTQSERLHNTSGSMWSCDAIDQLSLTVNSFWLYTSVKQLDFKKQCKLKITWGRAIDPVRRGKKIKKREPPVNKCMNLEVTIRNPPLHKVAIVVTGLGFFL